jgi:uncharacterized repeat protein (TIGR02059 family)
MKLRILILVLVLTSLSLSGATYYVSPKGSDASGTGTINVPWLTLNKALSRVSAGDIIYMRGGTYNYGKTGTTISGKNGSTGNYINIWAYPGESPVISYSNQTFSSQLKGIYVTNSSFIYIKGIRITGISQPLADIAQYGLFLNNNVSDCIFEQVETDHIGGWGICIYDDVYDILFINCDSHHNADPHSGDYGGGDNYGGSDGFECGSLTSSNIVLKGCRFWSNSDDGVDLRLAEGSFTFENCWSFWNGYIPGTTTAGGNGEGIKLAGTGIEHNVTETRRLVKNCLVFENRLAGIEDSPDDGYVGHEVYNTTVYNNGYQGMNFEYNSPAIVKNCISYMNGSAHENILDWQYSREVTHNNNSFDLSVNLNDQDFVSVNSAGMDGPRKADGSLPDVNFLKLAKGSDLIDAGTDVGLPYDGKAPDLGAFEFLSGSPTPLPIYISSVVEDDSPSLLEMTYDLYLNSSIVPATSSFKVKVNNLSVNINSVTISGHNVQLTLENPIKFGDEITVAYTKPANKSLQTINGGQAVSLSPTSVINNCQEIIKSNSSPVVVIKNEQTAYSGFVSEIDASGSNDPDNDHLIYEWIVPENLSVSSTSDSKIQFLAPIVNTSQSLEFKLNVSDGIDMVSKSVPISILPYKPELIMSKIKSIETSGYKNPDSPNNVSDGNIETKWSVVGDNQWLMFTLSEPFEISHLEIAFLSGQKYSSYFDIYVSKNNVTWVPVLINGTSCNFSGGMQVFEFPSSEINTGYQYLKFLGHGNSLNTLNSISEFKIFGTTVSNPGSGNSEQGKVIIYPNPAKNYVNISILNSTIKPDKIRIIDIRGKTVFEEALQQNISSIQIPLGLQAAVYTLELSINNSLLFIENLIVMN